MSFFRVSQYFCPSKHWCQWHVPLCGGVRVGNLRRGSSNLPKPRWQAANNGHWKQHFHHKNYVRYVLLPYMYHRPKSWTLHFSPPILCGLLDYAENKKKIKSMWVGLKANDDDTVCDSASSCQGKLTNHGPAETTWTFEGGDFLSDIPMSIDSKNFGRCITMNVPIDPHRGRDDPGENYKLYSVHCQEKKAFVCNAPCPPGNLQVRKLGGHEARKKVPPIFTEASTNTNRMRSILNRSLKLYTSACSVVFSLIAACKFCN